jgi:predicted phosphodiesterase
MENTPNFTTTKKVLFIGDIHGKFDWREIANEAKKRFVSEIVFLGDYVDSHDKNSSAVKQLDNLKSIITFARKTNESKLGSKVTLLLGNHDYAYLTGESGTSGYQHMHAFEFRDIFQKNIDLFNIAWGITEANGKYTLATHAGLTKEFYNNDILRQFKEGNFLNRLLNRDYPDDLQMHEILNLLKDRYSLLWKVGSVRGGYGTPGILWADHSELMMDPIEDINQIFGHTANYSITIDTIKDSKYYRIDTFWNNTPSLLLDFNVNI